MLGFFQKYKLFLCVGVALFCALAYDHCRNEKDESLRPIKPTDSGNSDEVKPEKVLGAIDATKLFIEFTENEKEAREKYIGKTYLIKGLISEVFSSSSLLQTMRDREKWNYVAGIMLFPETRENLEKLAKDGGDFSKFPELRSFAPLEHPVPERRDESGFVFRDFSHRSEYGGVYCSFPIEYRFEIPTINSEGTSERKEFVIKKIQVVCKVSDYKRGGSERISTITKPIDPYAEDWENLKSYGEKSIETKNRVILTECRERESVPVFLEND